MLRRWKRKSMGDRTDGIHLTVNIFMQKYKTSVAASSVSADAVKNITDHIEIATVAMGMLWQYA